MNNMHKNRAPVGECFFWYRLTQVSWIKSRGTGYVN